MTPHQQIQNLLNFIDSSPSPWHVVNTVESLLKPLQFTKLDEAAQWQLQPGGRYYVVRDESSVIPFVLEKSRYWRRGLRSSVRIPILPACG